MKILSRQFWTRPYVVVIVLLLLVLDVYGIAHAFTTDGAVNGAIAIVLPPYGWYEAVEAVTHPRISISDADAQRMAASNDGRRALAYDFQLKPEVWSALLTLIQSQKGNAVSTTMVESGITYNLTATVLPKGPVTLTVSNKANPDPTISMIATARGQQPDTLEITKMTNGKPVMTTTLLSKYSADDASQFLLAWSLAWGTIAEDAKSAVQQTTP